MVYTEIKQRNGRKYYYRVMSARKGKDVMKKRKYLGVNLKQADLKAKENEADKELNKNNNSELSRIKPKISRILKKHKIRKAGLFGSYAHGKQKKGSDIDILIQPTRSMSLFDIVNIRMELENKLKIKVDLLTYSGISPMIKKQILHDEVRVI